jgi:hypothetical protein
MRNKIFGMVVKWLILALVGAYIMALIIGNLTWGNIVLQAIMNFMFLVICNVRLKFRD